MHRLLLVSNSYQHGMGFLDHCEKELRAHFDALGLVPFNTNPHYLDPDPASTRRGETREQRIREFHEDNEPPVVGLREGAMLRVEGSAVHVAGINGARLFERGREPREFRPGDRLDFLM